MIQDFVIKLIDNLPDEITKTKDPVVIDLVLDGGAFNGSYLGGALYFLKEMEKRKYIKINRISGCSVGAIVGFLYCINGLHLMADLYEIIKNDFKKTHNLQIIKELKKYLGNNVPNDICQQINGRFFVTYHNIKKGTKPVKCNYADIDDILNTIVKSSYIPFLIDGNLLYKNKYLDGMTPFVFANEPNKKILYMDLLGYDKITSLINVKNEKSNYHRILSGLLDIHSFYIKQSNTQMCSYVGDWNIINRSGYNIRCLLEKLAIYVIYAVLLINKNIPADIRDGIIYKSLSKILYDIFLIILEGRCL